MRYAVQSGASSRAYEDRPHRICGPWLIAHHAVFEDEARREQLRRYRREAVYAPEPSRIGSEPAAQSGADGH